MNIKEDFIMIFRAIRKRPVESLLLIIGIALGIGATASGVSIVVRTIRESEALLSETRFREVVVSGRESTREMDLPAEPVQIGKVTMLSARDLAARDDVPAVEYAYTINRMHLWFGDFRSRRQRAAPPGESGPVPPEEGAGSEGEAKEGEIPPPPLMDFNQPELPEGPQPVLDELDGLQVSEEYFPAYGLAAAKGSLFTSSDIKNRESLMILGSEAAATLFEDGIAFGRQVLMYHQLFTITGVLEATGTELDMYGFTPAVIPEETGFILMGWDAILRFTVRDSADLSAAKAQLNQWFSQKYGQDKVVISIPREQAEELADRNRRLVTIILILAVSGLLIASVNVSNILYSRAIRKRKTIGVLKALGATRQAVFLLFFSEAVFLGVCGAIGGTGLAVILSGLMQNSLGIGGYSFGILGLGVLLSLTTTLLLTNIPALQTSKIPPSEAIRYE